MTYMQTIGVFLNLYCNNDPANLVDVHFAIGSDFIELVNRGQI